MIAILKAYRALVRRDLLLAVRNQSELLHPLLFFVVVLSLFPLGVSPAPDVLRTIAPGLIWVCALLATLLSLESLFRPDFEDGSLEQLLLCGQPVPVLVMAKVSTHWLVTGLPLIIVSPMMGLFLAMPAHALPSLMLSLLLGTPTLSLVGAIGVALTVGLRRGGMLLAILVLPLYIPVLVFGASLVMTSVNALPVTGHIYMLASFLVLALTLAPLATSAALRISVH